MVQGMRRHPANRTFAIGVVPKGNFEFANCHVIRITYCYQSAILTHVSKLGGILLENTIF